jgi:hypothetical protein
MEGGKFNGKPNLLPYGLRNPYRNLKSESSKLCTETSTKLYFHEFRFWCPYQNFPVRIFEIEVLQNFAHRILWNVLRVGTF